VPLLAAALTGWRQSFTPAPPFLPIGLWANKPAARPAQAALMFRATTPQSHDLAKR
jgi:hypothetical protein